MTNVKRLSKEDEALIIEAFKQGSKKSEIAKLFEINHTTVTNVLDRNGIENRKWSTTKKSSLKTCKYCGQQTAIQNARYCPWCGKPLKSELEMAMDRTYDSIRAVLKFAPSDMTDEVIKNWNSLGKIMREKVGDAT